MTTVFQNARTIFILDKSFNQGGHTGEDSPPKVVGLGGQPKNGHPGYNNVRD